MKAIKGASFKLKTTAYGETGLVQSIVGATITTSVKKNISDLDNAALFTKTVGTGVVITDGINGVCETSVNASDTNAISQAKIFFEVLIKLADGVTYIREKGEIELEQNIIKTLN